MQQTLLILSFLILKVSAVHKREYHKPGHSNNGLDEIFDNLGFYVEIFFIRPKEQGKNYKTLLEIRPILVGFSFFLQLAQPGMDGFTKRREES